MDGIGNQNRFRKSPEGPKSQMSHGELIALENDTISRKNPANRFLPKLENCFGIAQYAIVDRFDRNHVHPIRHFSIRGCSSKILRSPGIST
jgi:hypothetical protein